ncbi:hypothetical protein G6F46_012766 [Rhizopus delemar]|uniref:Uncharacterized protein n=2 Tax=Rhizopus TaxID=4842 RepID=I1CNM6_RHIO9|nr:hypothetical protein RO3G_14767 [Rhizopus delemar RA 99-880]KAG1487814.1 hypothetical protein G6F54_012431 [Rhizopus delemar]KAG1532715.1 hypothetical protein G6F51_012979 [Rhizopus arrhizus]KAG1578217.1 hypothetical protein G6F47_012917 [Rhizopus delemar]KAG1606783.1 hypothetical protein G6F46_012766 [Rhizopus delemar]|eukprot:EIE90056.1 hypothetical protein RO3G_14767 [Rhizopus delemar RA 99-880]
MVLSAINHDITGKANNPPGVADSRHNPNNKPFEFKTWAQTVKNQKRSVSFRNKPDVNNVANHESQTVFLQAIDKHPIVIAASEFEGLNFKDTVPHKTLQVFWFFSFFACHRVLSTAIGSMPYLI